MSTIVYEQSEYPSQYVLCVDVAHDYQIDKRHWHYDNIPKLLEGEKMNL